MGPAAVAGGTVGVVAMVKVRRGGRTRCGVTPRYHPPGYMASCRGGCGVAAWRIRFGEPAGGPAPADDPPRVLDQALPLFARPLDEAAAAAGVRPLSDFLFDDSALDAEAEREVLRER